MFKCDTKVLKRYIAVKVCKDLQTNDKITQHFYQNEYLKGN